MATRRITNLAGREASWHTSGVRLWGIVQRHVLDLGRLGESPVVGKGRGNHGYDRNRWPDMGSLVHLPSVETVGLDEPSEAAGHNQAM